ncbi:MAG: bifunctional metallophosphatase/5'-nucleotidase [Lachnospiraceae bacterium]|nr:bifunctional metallophosphatase/5'-nucleotidase [Lachnospiraceae bacterium]
MGIKSIFRKTICLLVAVTMTVSMAGCTVNINENVKAPDPASVEKNGDVMVLFTSDIHCGVDKGFTLAGLKQIRDGYEAQGYTTILVDDGDHVQGESLGTLTRGEAIIDLMNDMKYDLAIPGNHDFDYGMERFFELADMADFPYISCNFNKEGDLLFEPYKIIEAAGMKIGFVGVTTPETIIESTPAYFCNEEGDQIYQFKNGGNGEELYETIQDAVDNARKEGAEYIYLIGHLGNEDVCHPWNCYDVIENTTGIDVLLDGHSHDTGQLVIQNKNGEDVARSAVGTKLNCIGYSHISADGGITETNILSWPNDIPADKAFNIHNDISDKVTAKQEELEEITNEVVAHSSVDLIVNDPKEKDKNGNPIRIVRMKETNMGDLCADAMLRLTDSDVAIMNGGGIRASIGKGDITYGDIINVFPFGNELSVINVSGQQILDALEWGAKGLPDENGGFLQVAGMTYTIDLSVDSSCTKDENGMFTGIEGDRRVKDVMIGDSPVDPEGSYRLASIKYILNSHGDGYTMFDGAEVIQKGSMLDSQLLINYITQTLEGSVGEEYANPYGQGRITITDGSEEGDNE